MNENTKSYHIFLFPFRLKDCDGWETEIEKTNWERDAFEYAKGSYERNFSSQAYFYEFASGAIFDDNSPNRIVTQYRLSIGDDASYTIKIYGKPFEYKLHIDKILLNVYDDKVGILSFHLNNETYGDFDDILRINDFGRRIFPQYLSQDNGIVGPKSSFLADSICLDLNNGHVYEDDFEQYAKCTIPPFTLPKFIKGILPSSMRNAHWLLDDRMYVISWYVNNEMSGKLSKISFREGEISFDNDTFKKWYKYVFVDNNDLTCQSERMFQQLLSKATYDRWLKYGTVFGVSRYSFVVLGSLEYSTFFRDVVLGHIQTMYFNMVSLCLAQRTMGLYYSNEIAEISNTLRTDAKNDKELFLRVQKLSNDYLRYVNNIYFREITPQDQGIELYEMLQSQTAIGRDEKELNTEIEQLFNYINMTSDQKRNEFAQILNMIAAIAVPATIITGVFGMNPFPDSDSTWGNFWCEILLIAILIGIVIGGMKLYYRKNNRRKKHE